MLTWEWMGTVPYQNAVSFQEERRKEVLNGNKHAQKILLLQHPPVITLGNHAKDSDVLTDISTLMEQKNIQLERTNRGGAVTYHGFDQLMIYPVVYIKAGIVAYLKTVASTIIETLLELGIKKAIWKLNPAGIWIDNHKILSCGIHVRRYVSIHGFSLNILPRSTDWQWIIPCGEKKTTFTSVSEQCATQNLTIPTLPQLANLIGSNLCHRLNTLQ